MLVHAVCEESSLVKMNKYIVLALQKLNFLTILF